MPKTEAFTPSQLRELRSDLETDFALLLGSMTTEEQPSVPSGDEAWSREPDSDDVDTLLNEILQDRLTAIAAAIRRLDTGAYGVCAQCGSRISFGRLSVVPETTRCIACDGGGHLIDQADRVAAMTSSDN